MGWHFIKCHFNALEMEYLPETYGNFCQVNTDTHKAGNSNVNLSDFTSQKTNFFYNEQDPSDLHFSQMPTHLFEKQLAVKEQKFLRFNNIHK